MSSDSLNEINNKIQQTAIDSSSSKIASSDDRLESFLLNFFLK